MKNSRPDLATVWVNEFPWTHYLYISIPDSKVRETYATLAYRTGSTAYEMHPSSILIFPSQWHW